MLDNFRHIHYIGVGGSGISALAHLALAHGLKVSGSDMGENITTKQLADEGAEIFRGHSAENIPEHVELVVFTEAIDKKKNPEYLEAIKREIPCMSYFEALGEMSKAHKTIVVTGTHGKTTTTAMLGQALAEAEFDPKVIVGSRVPAFDGKNIRFGHSQWLVAEGCEYRRSFLSFEPFGMIMLNCELEHVDYYQNEADYVSAFKELAKKLPVDGFLVYNEEDENCRKIAEHCKAKCIPVKHSADVALQVPGRFNGMNAAHALFAGEEMGANTAKLIKGLEKFTGTARRMEIKGEKDDVLVIDDYGHHPTEVVATLGALRNKYKDKRIICVFQPHQYSRTHRLIGDFATSFGAADMIIISNIFEARDTEEDKEKVSAESLAAEIPNAEDGKGLEATAERLRKITKPGDLVVTMGAGDVYQIGESFLGL